MIIYSLDYVLGDTISPDPNRQPNANNPLIGWQTTLLGENIEASEEDPDHPASNMTNPATVEYWQGLTLDPFTVTFGVNSIDEIDYVAFAGHNLKGRAVVLEAADPDNLDTSGEPTWYPLTEETILVNNDPVLFRIEKASYLGLRLSFSDGDEVPMIAVTYMGALLVLQRNIFIGHSPINYSRSADVYTGLSENGHFLGRVVLSQIRATSIAVENVFPDFYRASVDPWVEAIPTTPFFFAWRPGDYPMEVGYCWAMSFPKPENTSSAKNKSRTEIGGLMGFSVDVQGFIK